MTAREVTVYNARSLISDEQLVAFLKVIRQRHAVRDAEYAMARLDKGERLDDFFYTGEECGYFLSVERSSETTLKIAFGCQDDPLSDEGSEWRVSFLGNDVATLSHEVSWVC